MSIIRETNKTSWWYDEQCQQPVTKRVVNDEEVYFLEFGNVDEGESVQKHFYIRNDTMGNLEQFTVKVQDPQVDQFSVQLASPPSVPSVGSRDKYHGIVECSAAQGIQAGSREVGISVDYMITVE